MATNKRIFYAGNYYLVDTNNYIIAHSDKIQDLKDIAEPSDTILIALTATGSSKYDPKVDKEIQQVEKIVIDFDKKLLTVDGDCAILFDKEFSKGDNILSDDDLQDWPDILKDARACAKSLVVVGNPPIEGKDITNEMSDL